jgi:hypothetical protein
MKEKFEKVLEFFRDKGIEIPTDVRNAIEDVFTENDSITDINIYFKEDAEVFESDVVLLKEIDAYVTDLSAGSVDDVYTYYGEIDYSLSEIYNLYDNKTSQTTIADVVNIDNQSKASILNSEQWAVVLIETTRWDEGKVEKIQKTYLYSPHSMEVASDGE